MKTIIITLLFFFVLGSSGIISQDLNTAKLDSLFSILENENQGMGSVAIMQNGVLVYKNAIGYSFIKETEKVASTKMTKYRIGSVSKMFTATMIFQLIEEKKIELSTTIDKFFPSMPNVGRITISNLLNHRSGLHSFTDEPDYMIWMSETKTRKEMIEIISNGGSDFKPDSKAAYSNANYVLLGYIIEQVTRKPYAINLQIQITSKLGLKNTYVGGEIDPKDNEAYSYQFTGAWKPYLETDMSIPGGAGAIVSTPADLTTFIDGLFSGKLVSGESLNQMKTMTDSYGMGMFQIPFYDKSGFGHSGSIDAFATSLAFFPDDSIAIAYCTNGQIYPMNEIIIAVLSIFYNRDYSIPVFETISLKPDELEYYLGVYTSEGFPLKLTVTMKDNTLFAQATGQRAIRLEATAIDKFKYDQAGIRIEFDRNKNVLLLKQGGVSYTFTRE